MEDKDKKIEDLQQDIYDTEGKYLKEKEDPNRLEKNNESIAQGVGHLNQQIEDLKKKKADLENDKSKWMNKIKDCELETKDVND